MMTPPNATAQRCASPRAIGIITWPQCALKRLIAQQKCAEVHIEAIDAQMAMAGAIHPLVFGKRIGRLRLQTRRRQTRGSLIVGQREPHPACADRQKVVAKSLYSHSYVML